MARAVAPALAVVRAVWMGDGGISWASVVVVITEADGPVTSCAADGAKACGVVVLQLLSILVAGWGEISLLRLLRPTVDEDESRACDKSADDAEGDTDAMGTVS